MSNLRQTASISFNTRVRSLVLFSLIWAFLVYIVAVKLGPTNQTEQRDFTTKRANQVLQLLIASKQRNDELKVLIEQFMK